MEHRCTLLVRSYELDTYGHVNNAVYLNYLEYARHQFLNDTGFPYDQFRKEGFGLYVARVDIRYLKPAFLEDELIIVSELTSMGRVKGSVRQTIVRGEESIVEAFVDFATVNGEGRPAPMPEDARRAWSAAGALKQHGS
ncbi:thioesterase family protein [Marispirochaeta sp.]|jgi:acyl-CoA thioester hydrolase|uniref:acyl-CoA thioesterase n=1 Tax=Marispirochaeta sp. TaxID=2038653 RepID=UPI0029C85A23|nr:thioesterase family protein [Marispirochaeta sp.]